MHLDILPEQQAVELLWRTAGQDDVTAERAAALEVVRRCGCLPLAIRIAGARLAARRGWPIRKLADRLANAGDPLQEFQFGELAVRASFEVSWRALRGSTDPMARMAASAFAMLGVIDGPDVALEAAARLLDKPVNVSEELLELLVAAQLLEAPQPARYRYHDLVRMYARELASRELSEVERHAGLARVLEFYWATSSEALALHYPNSWRLPHKGLLPRHPGLAFPDGRAGLDWVDAERANIVAVIRQAEQVFGRGEQGVSHEVVTGLVLVLSGLCIARGYWRELADVNETIVGIDQRVEDPATRARALNDLGIAYMSLGRVAEALTCQEENVGICDRLGDRRGEASGLINAGCCIETLGRPRDAERKYVLALDICRQIGYRAGEACALLNLGDVKVRLGHPAEAIVHVREALTLARQIHDTLFEASSLRSLGTAMSQLGLEEEAIASCRAGIAVLRDYGNRSLLAGHLRRLAEVLMRTGRNVEAIDCAQESLVISRDFGAKTSQAEALRTLGDALHVVGLREEARAAWQEGLALAEAAGISEASDIRERLGVLGPDGAK